MKGSALTITKLLVLGIFIATDILSVAPQELFVVSSSSLRAISSANAGLDVIGGEEGGEKEPTQLPVEDIESMWPGVETLEDIASIMDKLDKAKERYESGDLADISLASETLLRYAYSANQRIRDKVADILKNRNNLFVIRYIPLESAEIRESASIKYRFGTIPDERDFDNMVKAGFIRPVVIVNIKRFSPRTELVYAAEMRRISKYYNGNITFILKVEEPEETLADLSGVMDVLYETMNIMGEDFYETITIQIPDGGLKSRLGPVSLFYTMQGLVPYYQDTLYLHEVMRRAGRAVMQMPHLGRRDHIICASDTIFEPRTLHFDRSKERKLQIAYRRTLRYEIRPELRPPSRLLFVNGKPQWFASDRYRAEETRRVLLEKPEDAAVNGLYYMFVWEKKDLLDFTTQINLFQIKDKKPFLYAPINLYTEILRSVFLTEEEWRRLYESYSMPAMTQEDWMRIRELALRFFGRNGERVHFVEGKIRDEGRLIRIIERFRRPTKVFNKVKIAPGILLGNATEAKLDRVVFRGKGVVTFGKDVNLTNVIIELDGGHLKIPDNWVIRDSYIGMNTFGRGGGLVAGALAHGKEGLVPLTGRRFRAFYCSSVVSKVEEKPTLVEEEPPKPLFISAALDAPTIIKGNGKTYTFEELKPDIYTPQNHHNIALLWRILDQEFEDMPDIFPLDIKATVKATEYPTHSLIHNLSDRIIEEQQKRGGKYWVVIEGIQAAGKTFFAKRLAQSLKARGKNVVVVQEDWYHKPRSKRDEMQEKDREEWKKHSRNWHRWDALRRDLQRIHSATRADTIELKKLYKRSTGRCELKRKIRVTPDTIVIYTGEYTHDITTMSNDYSSGLFDALLHSSLRIYLGISQGESLELKRKRDTAWRTPEEVESLDEIVYKPAFRRYISTYDPAAHSDVVLRANVEDRSLITEVTPRTRSLYIEGLKDYEDYKPPVTKKVVIFGAGAVGRGLFGLGFRRSGYAPIFIDTNEALVSRLQRNEEYIVVHVSGRGDKREGRHHHIVDNVKAILSTETDEITNSIVDSDIEAICIAVPDEQLSIVYRRLGRWLEQRILRGKTNPIDIFLSTNALRAKENAWESIRTDIAEENREAVGECINIIETMTDCITRLGSERQIHTGSRTVYSEPFSTFTVEKEGFRRPTPDILGMHSVKDIDRLGMLKERKLYLYNSLHSFIAYLGYLRGYRYIDEALKDPWIEYEARRLSQIVSRALVEKYKFGEYKFGKYEMQEHIRDILNRFKNEALHDPVVRVARDPIRKLSPQERFVGALDLLKADDIKGKGAIALAIAACLQYSDEKDKEAKRLQGMIEDEGIEKVLSEVCKIDPQSQFGRLIREKYEELKAFGVAYGGFTLVEPKSTKGTTHVVMDFDGVIVDTIPIFRRHFAYIYWKIMNGISDDDSREPTPSELKAGKRYFDRIEGRYYVGQLIPDMLEHARRRGISPEKLKEPKEYLAEYLSRRNNEIAEILKRNPQDLLKPGVVGFLTTLRRRKKSIYLLTTADQERLDNMLDAFNLRKYFTAVIKAVGMDDKIQKLKELIEAEGIQPSQAILIDDNTRVMESAHERIGDDLHIIAVRDDIRRMRRYPHANFIFDDFYPDRNKTSIFMRTTCLVVPKGFIFSGSRQADAVVGIMAGNINREQNLVLQLESAA